MKMSKLSMVAIWILLITNGSPFSLPLDEIRKIKINDMLDFEVDIPSRNLITKTTDVMIEEISNPRTSDFNGTTTHKYEVEKANKHSIENAANRNQLHLKSQSKNSILDLDHTISMPNKISHSKKNSSKIVQNALKDVTRYRKRKAIREVQQSIVTCKKTTHKMCIPTTALRSGSASEVSKMTPINATSESFTNYSLKSVAGTTKLTSKEVTPLENVTYTTKAVPNLGGDETLKLEIKTSGVISSRQFSVTPTAIGTTLEGPKVGTPLENVRYTSKAIPTLGRNETLKFENETSVVTTNRQLSVTPTATSTTVEGPKVGTFGSTSPLAQLTSKEVTPLENVTYTTKAVPNLGGNETFKLEIKTSRVTSNKQLSVTPTTISTTDEGPKLGTLGLTLPLEITTTQTNTSQLKELTTKLDSDEIFNSDIAEDGSQTVREMGSEVTGEAALNMTSNVSKTTNGPAALQMPLTFGNHSMNVNLHSLFLGLRSNNMAFNVSYDSNSKNINGTVNVMTNPRTTLYQKSTQTTGYDFIIFPRR